MSFCDQYDITDAAFAHLRGIHTLKMAGCSQGITGQGFHHLEGVSVLELSRDFLSDAAVALGIRVRIVSGHN